MKPVVQQADADRHFPEQPLEALRRTAGRPDRPRRAVDPRPVRAVCDNVRHLEFAHPAVAIGKADHPDTGPHRVVRRLGMQHLRDRQAAGDDLHLAAAHPGRHGRIHVAEATRRVERVQPGRRFDSVPFDAVAPQQVGGMRAQRVDPPQPFAVRQRRDRNLAGRDAAVPALEPRQPRRPAISAAVAQRRHRLRRLLLQPGQRGQAVGGPCETLVAPGPVGESRRAVGPLDQQGIGIGVERGCEVAATGAFGGKPPRRPARPRAPASPAPAPTAGAQPPPRQ